MNKLMDAITVLADEAQAANLSRFFKTGPGQYGEGDRFLGIKVPMVRIVVKEHWRDTDFAQLEECLDRLLGDSGQYEAASRVCLQYLNENTGSTELILTEVERCLAKTI